MHAATPRGASNAESRGIQQASSTSARPAAEDAVAPEPATSALTPEEFLAMWAHSQDQAEMGSNDATGQTGVPYRPTSNQSYVEGAAASSPAKSSLTPEEFLAIWAANSSQGYAGTGEAGAWSNGAMGQAGVLCRPTADPAYSQHPFHTANQHFGNGFNSAENQLAFAATQQNYSQDSHLLNHIPNAPMQSSSVGFISQAGGAFFAEDYSQQANAVDLFDPIPLSRQM